MKLSVKISNDKSRYPVSGDTVTVENRTFIFREKPVKSNEVLIGDNPGQNLAEAIGEFAVWNEGTNEIVIRENK